MKVCIAVTTLKRNDAIGNDVMHQFKVLTHNHIKTVIFTQEVEVKEMHPHVIDGNGAASLLSDPDTLLIYHHGGCWDDGFNLLKEAQCRCYVKYHNVTPAHFFTPYNKTYEHFCARGVEQTAALAHLKNITAFLCDSPFNAQEMQAHGVSSDRIKIVPPFHKLDDFKTCQIDPALARTLQAPDSVNLLFVGRVVPNKGHSHLIRVAGACRRMYDDNIQLYLAGGMDPALDSYFQDLKTLARQEGVSDRVHFTGAISFNALYTYYAHSHLFLLMSSHEGFCLPVLEAQYNRLPVIALDSCAVSHTMGPEQLLFEKPDYPTFAAAVHVLFHSSACRTHLATAGRKNLQRFDNATTEGLFLKALELTR